MRRIFVAAAVALCALIVSACGGGSDELTVPEDEVDAFLAAAIPEADELPGEGWTVTEEDAFDDSDEPPADTPECRAVNDIVVTTRHEHEDQRLGRTSREFDRDMGPSVQVDVAVFDNDGAVEASLEALEASASSDDFLPCFTAVFEALGEDVEVASESVEAWADAPRDGSASASEFALTDRGQSLTLRIETYGWNIGNAGVIVSITGESEAVAEEVVTNLIATIAAKMEAAAGED